VTTTTRRIEAVVFDMDGTLLDSLAVHLESYRLAIVGSGGRNRSHEDILASFIIGPAAIMLEALIERPVGAEAVTRYLVHLRELSAQVRPYPGVATALRELSPRFRLGVFTAADTSAAEMLLSATGLRSFFDVVIGADRAGRTKPAPDGLLLACDALGVHPADAAYVGDGPSDVAVARACGALAVAAGWGHQFTADRDADIVVATPQDLVRSLVDGAA
jgi:HAD superfamily hydrolase (TIGR01549 family)